MHDLQESSRSGVRRVDHLARAATSLLAVNWDQAAHDGIARQHGALLYQLARYLTSNDSDARDLVQDTFERSLRKLPAGLPPDRIQRWLLVTLRNRFLDLRRSVECRGRVCLPIAGLFALPSQDPEEEPHWARVDPAEVWRCVDHLNPVLRQVFLLRVRDRRSHAAIAAELGIPLSTVGTRYFRALRHLRRMLDHARGPAEEHVRLAG
jgi:RNA polymerase sigma-70 factor (ECF subfamily)